MKVLVTGAAGFIGYHLSEKLLLAGYTVVGLDNLNDYYDVHLKLGRLTQLGIEGSSFIYNQSYQGDKHKQQFTFFKLNLEDRSALDALFKEQGFDLVCHLAAQAGVRYSLEQPFAYLDSNINGFLTILEGCRNYGVNKLIYASSSSVYGLNDKVPFSTTDIVDHPISLYAATKKSNELMAHTYSHLFGIQTIGLRFFTVYGPWGRPDMAMFLFTDAILHDKPIKVFNHGNLSRDFTYIDDIVGGISKIISAFEAGTIQPRYKVYNIGNSAPVKLLDFIEAIEEVTGKKAIKEWLPMQPGDVEQTWADVDDLIQDFNYNPNTDIKVGVAAFVQWYKDYYSV
ncbi:NAD-dependent epimerase [Flavobacterium piscinae]|uniref:NAD-dependent epimerase n=1 Tax=Flavobacterium piscinae TaxID=2506424 RepID=A0A4Q1KFE3_9FLAO|nr:NAD-dependent epimerase [Flavobacterium piscinae]RXR27739.1 NAD-dependent epimerase [Flavobacterium piscinae]